MRTHVFLRQLRQGFEEISESNSWQYLLQPFLSRRGGYPYLYLVSVKLQREVFSHMPRLVVQVALVSNFLAREWSVSCINTQSLKR